MMLVGMMTCDSLSCRTKKNGWVQARGLGSLAYRAVWGLTGATKCNEEGNSDSSDDESFD